MLVRYPAADLAALVVWVPMRGGVEGHVADAASTLTDARVRHFWDGGEDAMNAFSPVLGIKDRLPAWDVYLIYGPDARWEAGAAPPEPVYWAHQLTHQHYQPMPGPLLDAALFSDQLAKLFPR